jgi:dienelactone hydrolase
MQFEARAASVSRFGATTMRDVVKGVLAVGLCALVGAPSAVGAVHLSVAPPDSLIDAVVHIHVTGLRPRTSVTLSAGTVDTEGKAWRSKAGYVANAHGVVDPAVNRSVRGTYTGSGPMGLFWSMLPVGWKGLTTKVGMAPATVGKVRIAVHLHGRVVARAQIVRRTTTPAVSIRTETLERDGFIGRFCSQSSTTPRPAILRFGGSEGGLPGDATCTILAAHGYPTLNLAYFGLPGLPAVLSQIPLEYFARALQWLDEQPGVDPTKVVAMGISRGGEAALIIGSVYPQYVHGVVGLVPSSVVNHALGGPDPAWTLGGKPLPFVQIPVERIDGPVFVVGAGMDALWPSAIYVHEIAVRLRNHGRTDFTALVYPHAGHAIGSLLPNFRLGDFEFGGSPGADARARAAAWPKLLGVLSKWTDGLRVRSGWRRPVPAGLPDARGA